MASLTLSKVCKRFDNHTVVSDVDIDIRDGEFMVFVGPSGCGKSTTLRMVAGLENPSSGEIRIADRLVNETHPADRDVAMVFQSYALYPHMSVFDNMAYGLKRRGLPKAEIARRVNDTATMLKLDELLQRRPSQLSGGQRQRVALGRAIVRKPSVFLMDEPLSNLDAKLRVEMRGELGRLHAALKVTTIYVTHDQVEAMTMGDRIVVMNAGRVEQIGPPLDLYQRPATLFVAQFLGLPEINILKGRVEASGADRRFVGEGLSVPLPANTAATGDVALGLRPQTLLGTPVGEPTEGRHVLGEARVTAVEHHGPESYVSCTLGNLPLTVSVAPASHLGIGDRVVVSATMTDPHLFSAATGQRI